MAAAILSPAPVRNISTHFAQDQVERRRPSVISPSSPPAAATSPVSQPKTLKRIFRSSLQETIRNVTSAKKSREKISHESTESNELEKASTQKPQGPPPSAFGSHFHRPSIFRRSFENGSSNGTVNTPSASSSRTSTPAPPAPRKSLDRSANPHSLTIQTNNVTPPANESHRPRVLRKHSTRVKTRSGADLAPGPNKNHTAEPTTSEGERPEQPDAAENIGWSAFVVPTLSKGSMSSPTLLQHIAEDAKQNSNDVASSPKSRSPLSSLGVFFPQSRSRKLSVAEPPSSTRQPPQKDSDKAPAPTSGKGDFRKRVSSSILPSKFLSGTIKTSGGGDSKTDTRPSPANPTGSKPSHPPLVISRPKMLPSEHLALPAIPPRSPSRLLANSHASSSTSQLEDLGSQSGTSLKPGRREGLKVDTKREDGGAPTKSKISPRIIGMGHPSTIMRRVPSASTSNLPSTATLFPDNGSSPEPGSSSSSPSNDVSDSLQARRVSEDALTIRASASSPSIARLGSSSSVLSPAPNSGTGRSSPRLRATSSTAASRARATSPSSIKGGGPKGSLEGGARSTGHLVPRATSPSTGTKHHRRGSSSSITRPSPSSSPTPGAVAGSRSSRLGRGLGSASTSHLPIEARNTSPLPSSPNPSPSPSPISRAASHEGPRLAPRRSSSSRPSHSHSVSVPAVPSLVSSRRDDEVNTGRSQLPPESPSVKSQSSQHQPRPATSSSVRSSASPVPESPSSVVTYKERCANESTSSLLPADGYTPSPQRDIIRRATSALVKEVIHKKHNSGFKPELSKVEVEEIGSRMRSLVRLERSWSTNMVTASGEERERRAFGDALRDGYILCQYINKVCPGSVVRVDSSTPALAVKQLNVSKFLAAVAAFGVPSSEMFDVEDLTVAPFTSDGLARVALTILAVKKLQDNPPPKKLQPKGYTPQQRPSSSSSSSATPANALRASSPTTLTSPTSPINGVYLPSNAGLASASTPNLTRPTSPIPIPIPISGKRTRQVAPIAIPPASSSPRRSPDESALIVENDEDVFGPVGNIPRARPNMKLSSTSRASMASTHTETSVYSNVLDNRSSRFETIRTVTTEATSLASDIPSLTHTEASVAKAFLAKESPQQRIRRLSSPNNPTEDPPWRKDRRRSDSIDLSRVAEESEEGTIPTRHLNGIDNQPQKIIKLGQAKWPDDFMKVFDMSPEKKGSATDDNERGRERGMVNLDESLRRIPIRSRRSQESVEPITPPPLGSRVRRGLSPRGPQLLASGDLGSRVSPRSSFEGSPVRRPIDGNGSSPIPFPCSVSVSQLSTLPSSSETLLPPPNVKPKDTSAKVRRPDADQPKDRRSSFGDSPNPRIPMRPRHESINVSPVDSKVERSLIGGMDGSQVRKTLIVKEDGKPATHYQLGNCIGRGQFGTVYRALNLNTGQTVAVKRIRLEGLSEKDIKQLMHEVEIVEQLSHPSIVKYEGMARDPDILSIVLEYAENGSLAQTLKAFGKLNESLVASFVAKVLEGLHYLHTSEVIHCDLKAANILTTKTGNVKLSDFGVSLNLRAMEQMNNDVAGTPNWMAPEVIELKGASPASDIWSLACTIVELLTGKPPYADIQNGLTVMFRIVEDPIPPLPEGLSEPLKDFLTLCFNKDPTKRPNAETLFEHPWLKNEWGMYKELRPQDSIPFLRRVSADLQRTDIRRLSFVDDDRPNSPGSPRSLAGSPIIINAIEAVARPHDFVKSSFSQAVTCRVCNQAVKKSALFCKECCLIAHSKCAVDIEDSCEARGRIIVRPSQDGLLRQPTFTTDSRQTTPTPNGPRLHPSPSLTTVADSGTPSSPTANDRFRLFGRKRSKASVMLTASTEDLKDLKNGASSTPPVAYRHNGIGVGGGVGAGKPTMRIPRSPSQENGQWRTSVGSSDHSASMRSALTTRSSHLSGSNRGSEHEPIPENSAGSNDKTDTRKQTDQQQQSTKKSRPESDKCTLQ